MRASAHRRKHRQLIVLFQKRVRGGVFLVHCKQKRTPEASKLRKSFRQFLESTRNSCWSSQRDLESIGINCVSCGAKKEHTDLYSLVHSSSIFLPLCPLLLANSCTRARSS